MGVEYMPDFEAVHFAYSNWCDLPYAGSLGQAGDVWRELKSRIERMGRYPLISAHCNWAVGKAMSQWPEKAAEAVRYGEKVSDSLRQRRPADARRALSSLAMIVPDMGLFEEASAMLDEMLRAEQAGLVDNYWRNSGGREGSGKLWHGLVQISESEWRDRADEVLFSAYEYAVNTGLQYICGDDVRATEPEIRRWMDLESPDGIALLLAAQHPPAVRPDADLDHVSVVVGDAMKERMQPARQLIGRFLRDAYKEAIDPAVLVESIALREVTEREFGSTFIRYALDGDFEPVKPVKAAQPNVAEMVI